MIPSSPTSFERQNWYYRRKIKEIYESLAYVMMLEYLPERLTAMQFQPTIPRHEPARPSLHPLHAKVRIGEYRRVK